MRLIKIPFPVMDMVPFPDSEELEVFTADNGKIGILKSIDNTPKWGKLKHVSISRSDRYPSWEEILEIKEMLFGDIDVMMVMPKKEDYVNVHKNCFHLWQTPERWELQ